MAAGKYLGDVQVLFLTTSFPRAPDDVVGTFIYRLATSLSRSGVGVTVLAPGTPDAPSDVWLDGIHVRRVRYMWPESRQTLAYGFGIPENLRQHPARVLQAPLLFLSMVVVALRLARRHDVIHAHWSAMGLAARVASAISRRPYVVSVWGSDLRSLPGWMNRLALGAAKQIIGVGLEQVRQAEALGFEIQTIPAPLDMTVYNGLPDRTGAARRLGIDPDLPTIALVARMAPEKDPMTMVEAMPFVLDRIRAQLILVGGGPLVESLRLRASELGLTGSIHILGPRSDVPACLASADVFVALSPVENVWSTTITEATMAGLACIVTDAGYTTEVFTHERDVLIVPPRDPVAVAAAVVRLLRAPTERRRLVANCLELHARHGHTPDEIVERHTRIYRRALCPPEPE